MTDSSNILSSRVIQKLVRRHRKILQCSECKELKKVSTYQMILYSSNMCPDRVNIKMCLGCYTKIYKMKLNKSEDK